MTSQKLNFFHNFELFSFLLEHCPASPRHEGIFIGPGVGTALQPDLISVLMAGRKTRGDC